jgi:hypothetical protein
MENTQNEAVQTPLNTPRRSDGGLLGRNMWNKAERRNIET